MSDNRARRIALVDDDQDARDLAEFLLQRAGMAVAAFESTEDVKPFLETEGASIVITDLILPGLSGLDLVQWMRAREDTHDIPVVALTGRSGLPSEQRSFFDEFLVKPVHPAELVAKVRSLLDRSLPDRSLPDRAPPDRALPDRALPDRRS